jgi:hypothetical protein
VAHIRTVASLADATVDWVTPTRDELVKKAKKNGPSRRGERRPGPDRRIRLAGNTSRLSAE